MIISVRVNFHHENLPPTEQAANLHGLRVFYQIMEWRFLSDGMKNAEEWGWNKKDGLNMFPIITTAEYAPSYLQHDVRCQRMKSSKKPCSTNKCTCRKHGLPCLPSCGGCGGEDCYN